MVIDSELDVFRFAHQSVREYLKPHKGYSSFETHTLALERCLYVNTFELAMIPRTGSTIKENSILQPYANLYWPVRYQKSGSNKLAEDLQKKVIDFLFFGATILVRHSQDGYQLRANYLRL